MEDGRWEMEVCNVPIKKPLFEGLSLRTGPYKLLFNVLIFNALVFSMQSIQKIIEINCTIIYGVRALMGNHVDGNLSFVICLVNLEAKNGL